MQVVPKTEIPRLKNAQVSEIDDKAKEERKRGRLTNGNKLESDVELQR